MNLKFYKVSEDESKVSYWIIAEYWDKSFMPQVKYVEAKAFCRFDKIIKTIAFDPKRTDSYFFENNNEPVMIEAHLKDINKKQREFPETDSIITC